MVCKTNKKRLDTLKKRKTVIHNLFKKDKKTGQILLKRDVDLLYEKPGEKLRKNIVVFVISQIESINKNYSNIYLREIIFGPPRESFAPGATLATDPISKRLVSCYLMHITYNKDLDMFNVTTAAVDDTYNSFGQFNHSKKFVIDLWENEDARSLSNAFVGRFRHRNTTSDKLPKDILKTVTENSFDELYKQVWENNHKKPESLVYYYYSGSNRDQIAQIKIDNNLYYNEDRLANIRGKILDEQRLYYKGIKSKGINGNLDSFYEKITIKTSPNDVIIAEANYPQDSSLTSQTTTDSDQETFIVTGASGIFTGAKKIVIEYDNDLTKDFSQLLDQEIKNQGLKFRKITVTF